MMSILEQDSNSKIKDVERGLQRTLAPFTDGYGNLKTMEGVEQAVYNFFKYRDIKYSTQLSEGLDESPNYDMSCYVIACEVEGSIQIVIYRVYYN